MVFYMTAARNTTLSFFFSSRRRHTRWNCDWSSDVCSSDLPESRAFHPEQRLGLAPALRAHLEEPNRLAGWSTPLGRIAPGRSEERRVGKECRFWWSGYHLR